MMAEHSSFFNSVNHDRKYKAGDWAEYFSSFITNGVFPNPGTNLQVLATGTSMTVTVAAGKGWIKGYLYYNDSVLSIPLTIADGATNRIDRVVMRFDTANRLISIKVKQGTYATTPTAPAIERDADYYELALADVYVGAGVTGIRQADITDERLNTSVCGWVNSLIQADTTAIFNQMQDWFQKQVDNFNKDHSDWSSALSVAQAAFSQEFSAWFDGIKGQLSTDAAGNLQNQITSILNTTIAAINTTIKSDESNDALLQDIKGTIQYPTIVNGQITEIDHKSGTTVIRSDVFTYTTNLITEVRTIVATGATVTLKYHLDTLETEVI